MERSIKNYRHIAQGELTELQKKLGDIKEEPVVFTVEWSATGKQGNDEIRQIQIECGIYIPSCIPTRDEDVVETRHAKNAHGKPNPPQSGEHLALTWP